MSRNFWTILAGRESLPLVMAGDADVAPCPRAAARKAVVRAGKPGCADAFPAGMGGGMSPTAIGRFSPEPAPPTEHAA